ncbi:MAG: glycosyltransferase, partial [Bacteroidetes bacterium]|nr:glycosyltransferase [Bacteroidota bacterium]
MLSICIPVFNYDCRQLITDLSKQVESIDRPIEIIVVNDGSEKSFDNIYTNGLPAEVRYYSLAENIGRSKIRNQFIELALYDYLLFLDCDVRLISGNYIQLFVDRILTGPQ